MHTTPAWLAAALLALSLALAAGCSGGDDDAACGPAGAPVDGLTVTVGADSVVFGGFEAGDNQDCGLDSLTIDGTQVDPQASFHITFCVPDPAGLGAEPIPVPDPRVAVINVSASIGDCTIAIDRDRAATATIAFSGICAGGLDPAGFALEVAGDLPVVETCPGEPDPVESDETLTWSGRVAVQAP